jgi:choline dehydrogenase-like flavoprotein
MGIAAAPLAVVAVRLRVIGLDGLRVIAASVMPSVTSANPTAPTMMIAEKGADLNLAAARARPARAAA